MILLPFLFALFFFLTLALKLLGGHISWWIVIISGALFILPIIILVALDIISRIRNKNNKI
ncbi:MAG TPA: hypothetical protein VJK30_03250 [Coxiellaceae bacterium]|nr:hypothetical protein [Coxiellaceae bacterium]